MKVRLLFLCLFLFLPLNLCGAQTPEPTLPPVFVTSTRTEIPLQQVTTSASEITTQDIQQQQAAMVLETLRSVPGLEVVQSGSRGNATSVFIRGADADHVLVLVDGVEVNSTTLGAFDFAHLTTDNIERIEIIRGSGGTLYGSQAIGGVINIITKRGQGPMEASATLQGGNGWTNRQAFTLNGSAGNLGYFFSGSHLGTQGFRSVNDDYRNVSSSARLDYQTTENARLTGIFQFVKTNLGLFNNNSFASQPDSNAREAGTQYLAKGEWQQKILPNWDYRISGSMFKEHFTDTDDVDSCVFFGSPCDSSRTHDIFRTRIDTGELQTNYRFGEWSTTTFGTQYQRRSADTSGGIDNAIRNLGYYLQQQLGLLDQRLIMIPGIRLDDNQSFGTAWTPSFSAAYLFRETGTKIKMSYAKGFKAPTLNQLFFPAAFGCPAFGNPNLKPERSWELDAGVEQNLLNDRVKVGATYFHREVKNLIEAEPIPNDPFGCFRAQNVGIARFDGVEWTLAVQLLEALTLNANYTYLDWDTADGKLPRRSRNFGNVALNYIYRGWNTNLSVNIVGRRDDFRAASPFGDVTQPGYAIFNLASYYTLPWRVPAVKDLQLVGRINNLFNKRYEEVNGFRSPPFNFLLGVRATFGS